MQFMSMSVNLCLAQTLQSEYIPGVLRVKFKVETALSVTKYATIASAGQTVSLKVFDITGQTVRTLVVEPRQSGQHTVEWNAIDDAGRRVASGVYWYRLTVGGKSLTTEMTLLK